MELELRREHFWAIGGAGLLFFLILMLVIGRAVTPYENGRPQILSPSRWQALRLERQAVKELKTLYDDLDDLRAMLEQGRPNAVDAMLLAQRIYAHHRTGTVTTRVARAALIQAAEQAARYAAGEIPRAEAVDAYNMAKERIATLGSEYRR